MNRVSLASLLSAFAIALVVVVGCDRAGTVSKNSESASAAAALPAGMIVTTAPADAKGVVELKGSAKDGDDVVVRGIVGGTEDPVAANQAIVTLLDTGVTTCDKMGMDKDTCKTPWDACCEKDLSAKVATVQVVGADGKPLKGSLSAAGLKPLKQVVVAGKARVPADGKALVIEASKIHVVQ
jgi:hypothetical protein